MIKKLFWVFFLFSMEVASQQVTDSIRVTKNKILPVELKTENNQLENYLKVKDWVDDFYRDPKQVTVVDQVNKKIRINALDRFTFKWMGKTTYDYSYSLSIVLVDNKIILSFSDVLLFGEKRAPQFFYKKSKRKKQKVNKRMFNSFVGSLNDIVSNLKEFLKN